MKKQNLVIAYDYDHGLAYGLWQILQSEHRVYPYKLPGVSPMPGASAISKRLQQKRDVDFNLAEYQPVHGVIVAGYDKSNVRQLTKELDKRRTINVLLANTDEDIDEVILSMCNAEITRFETSQQIKLLEHVYHLEHCILSGGNTAYWKELLEESLPFLKTEERKQHVLEI